MRDWYKIFAMELGICYFAQNENLDDDELGEAFEEDETILEGILMEMLLNVGMLEEI